MHIAIDDNYEIIEDALNGAIEDHNIEVGESIIKLDDSNNIKEDDSSVSLIGLVLMIIFTVGFVYYMKFRNSNSNLKFLYKSKKSTIIKTIHFDDTVTVKINSLDKNS